MVFGEKLRFAFFFPAVGTPASLWGKAAGPPGRLLNEKEIKLSGEGAGSAARG